MLPRRDLAVLLLPALLLTVAEWSQDCEAVDVGEAEDSASSCPNVTTVSISGSSSNATTTSTSSSCTVQITVAATCKSSVVKVTASSSGVRTMDLRSRAIAAVESLPAVDTIRLDNNQIRAFTTANNISALYLANNSIPTLDDFKFPSDLTVLDLANNALGDIDDAELPSSLQYLNLSGNPIGSLSNISFPSSLQQLDLVGSSVATLENFSFPSSVTTLNFSHNPITVIRGVIFPDSLMEFTLVATANPTATTTTSAESVATPDEARALQAVATGVAAQAASVLVEFEVRQSDADMFEKMSLWDVSPTSTLSCSDSNANPRYVQDTMLCVLSDSEFAAKYESVVIGASSGSTSGSMWGTDGSSSQAAERIVLKETLHQRRSWFLIGAAALLSACSILMFVNAFCVCLRRKVCGPSKESGQGKTASSRSNHYWHESGSMKPDDEVRNLLSSDPSTISAENSSQPENEPAVRNYSAVKKETSSDLMERLTEELQRWNIRDSLIKHQELLSAARGSADNESGGSTSSFAYFKAVYQRKAIILKILQIPTLEGGKRDIGISRELLGFIEEIRLSSGLSHPQLVRLYGFVKMDHAEQTEAIGGGGVALVMEYMSKGDLNAFIQSHKKQTEKFKPKQHRTGMQGRTNLVVKRVGWDDKPYDDRITGDVSDDDYEEDILRSDDEVTTTDGQLRWSWRNSSAVYKSKLLIAIEVAQAVQYLHSFTPPLFHGNFSSRKIFLDNDWNVKLGDLTCCSALRRWSSAHKQHDTSSSPSTTGSPARGSGRSTTSSQVSGEEIHMDMTVWTAPEVLDGRQYTQKADIYSFGVLLAQLATYECSSAEHSVMDDTEVPMLNNTQKEQLADGEAPTPILLLMFRCQAFQPEVRPTADELLQELQQIEHELTTKSSA